MSIFTSWPTGCYPGGALYIGEHENLKSTRIIASLEKKYGLTVTTGPERKDDKVVMPERSRVSKNEIEKSLRTGISPTRLLLQNVIDEALLDKPSLRDFADRLMTADVVIKPNIASTGRVNGLSFELNGIAFSGSQLGKKYGWKQLHKDLDYQSNRDNGLLQRLKEVARRNDKIKASSETSERPERASTKARQDGERDRAVHGYDDKTARSISSEISQSIQSNKQPDDKHQDIATHVDSVTDSHRKHITNKNLTDLEINNNVRTNTIIIRSKKPGVAKVGARPPAQISHRMRNMSFRGMDGLTGRRKLLLPSNVPYELELSGADSDQRLRRPIFERTTLIHPYRNKAMNDNRMKDHLNNHHDAESKLEDEKPMIIIDMGKTTSSEPVDNAEQLRRNEQFRQTLQLAFEQRGNSYYHKTTGKLAFVDEGDKIKGYKGLLNRDGSQNMTAHKAMSQAAQIKFGDEFRSTGDEDYLKASWLSAALIGCNDTGYQPEARDLDMLSEMIKEHTKKYKRAPKLHAKTRAALDEHEANLRNTQKHMKTASGGKSDAGIKAEQERQLNQKQSATVNIGNMVDRFRNKQEQANNHENKPDKPGI